MRNRFILFLILFLSGNSCKKGNPDSEEIVYLSQHCTSADTIINVIAENPQNFKPTVISNALMRFYFGKEKEEARKLITNWRNHPHLSVIDPYKPFLLIDLGYYYLWEEQLDSVDHFISLREKINVTDTWNSLSFFSLKGSHAYLIKNFDAAKQIFLEGYILAKKYNINRYIEQFSVNLGAIAFQQGQYGTAAKFFSSAYAIISKEKRKNPVLINNLAACLLQENKPSLAKKILSTLGEETQRSDLSYTGILTKINLANATLFLNQTEEAKSYLLPLHTSNIPETLQGEYLATYLSLIKSNQWRNIDSFVTTNQTYLIRNKEVLLDKFGSSLQELINLNSSYFYQLGFDKIRPTELSSAKGKYFYFLLQADHFQKQNQLNKAYQSSLAAIKALDKYTVVSDSIKLSDINGNLKLLTIEDELKTRNIELEFTKKSNSKNQIIIILLIILTLGLALLGFYIYQNRNQKIQNAQLQLQNKTKEAVFLAQESKLNSRITSISKIIIEKSKFLAETIKKGPYSNEPEIHAVQRELEQLSMIDNAVNIQSAHEIFETKTDYLEFSAFKELNETQKRILVLSVENYKAKEIALALNLSYPYVRNVQSKLRKILNAVNLANFTDVKDLIQ